MVAIILFSLIAHAGFREHDGDPGPRFPCRRAEMNSCIESHNTARNAELNAIAAIDDKLRLLSRDQSALHNEKQALESEARKAGVTGEMAGREIREKGVLSSGEPIFSGGPRAEEFFFLSGEPNSWQELHSAERRARLNTLVIFSQKRSADLGQLLQNLSMEIDGLANTGASLQQERAQHGQQVNAHGYMCQQGCKEEFCRDQ